MKWHTYLPLDGIGSQTDPALNDMTAKAMSHERFPAPGECISEYPPAPVTHAWEQTLEHHRAFRIGGYCKLVRSEFAQDRRQEVLSVYSESAT